MAELVQHGQNGLRCSNLNDADSLKEQLLRVITDRAFWRRLRDNIAPERTVGQMVDDIESIYGSLGKPDGHARIPVSGMAPANS